MSKLYLDSSSGETWDKITFDLFNTGKFKQYLSSSTIQNFKRKIFFYNNDYILKKFAHVMHWEMQLIEKLILKYFLMKN